MATKSKRHTHKYHKVQVQGHTVWACAAPDCNHHMPEHYVHLVKGKYSYCWSCGEQFILDDKSMNEDKPHCVACRTGIKSEDMESFFEKGLS